MRPRNFEEFVGQEHIIGEGRVLRNNIESRRVPSLILWGPPGCGKTALAYLIATATGAHFASLSAVSAGVSDLRRVVEEARHRKHFYGQETILFIDEIHRFNKAQQDAILPYVEDGTVTLIGATTENPSFEVVSPLLSRCQVLTLHRLTPEQMKVIIERALRDGERGLGRYNVELEDRALEHLILMSQGDARIALNALEAACFAVPPRDGKRVVTLEIIEDALQRPALLYDKSGDWHYDIISALHKSLRGSDPDAALYWLARMLEAGEDPLYIARRMVRCACEDIGLADPQALAIAVAAYQAVQFVGLPEADLALAEAAVYLATAPKSNSLYIAYSRAREEARGTAGEPVPLHLRNPETKLMRELGYGRDYKYPHDYPGHFIPQNYLPSSLSGAKFYRPGDRGYEREIRSRLEQWWGHRKEEP